MTFDEHRQIILNFLIKQGEFENRWVKQPITSGGGDPSRNSEDVLSVGVLSVWDGGEGMTLGAFLKTFFATVLGCKFMIPRSTCAPM